MEDAGYHLPDDLRLLRDTVRRFVREEIVPEEEKIDPDAIELPRDVLARVRRTARAAGIWCIGSPQKYGGAELSIFGQSLVMEEASQCRMGIYNWAGGAFGQDPPNIMFAGTPEQIETYAVRQIAEGGHSYVAITEPSGGSDPAGAIQTKAEKRDGGWLLNGTKLFISYADIADYGVVFARSGREGDRHDSITAFILEKNTPGFTWKLVPVIRPHYPAELSLLDCVIPDSLRLGAEGQGFALASKWLTKGRIPYAARALGVGVAALRLAVDQANRRRTFGEMLASRQAIQWMIADSEMELRAARWLIWEAAWKADRGEDFRMEASIAKVVATETAGRVVDRVIQVFGGMGVCKELPLERWYRELRVNRIGEGPSEVQRMVVARSILGDHRRPRKE